MFRPILIAMKYIIMCGGTYQKWATPRQLIKINGEPVVARTIRLLREAGVTDIAISSNNDVFEQFGVPVLRHANSYNAAGYNDFTGYWCEAFYPMKEPACYIFGDVVFTPEAIRTIVDTPTDDIEFFASAPPFGPGYRKNYAEPFALKVEDQEHLHIAIEDCKRFDRSGLFRRKPIMWELWQVITRCPLNHIDYGSYVAINDATCDIDNPEEAELFV